MIRYKEEEVSIISYFIKKYKTKYLNYYNNNLDNKNKTIDIKSKKYKNKIK